MRKQHGSRARKLAAVVTIVAVAAAACGGDDDDSDDASTDDTEAQPTDEPADESAEDTPEPAAEPAEQPAEEPAEATEIQIAMYPGSLVNLPIYLAVEEGFFAEEGLEPILIDVPAAPQATAALVTGDLDVISNSPGNMMLVNKEGVGLVSVIDNYPAPVWTLVVQDDLDTPNADAPYPEMIKDLQGMTIGVPGIGSDGHNFARRFLSDAGLDPDQDATFLAVGLGPDALSAFEVGELDAVMAIEPVQSVIISRGGRALLDLAEDASVPEFESWTSSTWETTQSHADENADMMASFQAVQERAIEFVTDPTNRERAAEIWAEHNAALSVEEFAGILERLSSSFSTTFNCEGTANVGQFQVDNGLIEESDIQTCEELTWSGATQYLPSS